MSFFKKLIKKLKDGSIKDIINELLWIFTYSKKYVKEILLYIFLGIFGVAMSYGGGILSKFIIDTVTGQDTKKIVPVAIMYVLMILFSIASNALTSRVSAITNIKVNMEMRAEIYDKILQADWEQMSEYHSGDLLNRVDNDIGTVSSSVLGWWPNLVTGIVQFVGAFFIVLYYDPTLALISLLSAPVTLLMSRITMKKMRLYIKKTREISSDVMIFNEESFNNLQFIKSFGLVDYYAKKLREIQNVFKQTSLNYNKFTIITSTIMSLTGAAVSIFCFGWGVYRLWSGAITFGTMTLFLQMAGALSSTFGQLVHLIPSAISAATAAGRVMAISELPKENRDDDPKAIEFLENNAENAISIQASDTSFKYHSGDIVLHDVSFNAKPGELIALIGPSGSGKTTMLRLLLGIIKPSKGEMKIKALSSGDEIRISPSTRRMFSYVPQKNAMFSGSIADNIRIIKPTATDDEIINALKLSCAYDFIEKLPNGINSPILENGGGFSEGQIQRISIARALIADTPILLLDEATSALDMDTEKEVLRNIIESSANKICIVTTHRPGVLSACDSIYKIENHTVKKAEREEIDEIIYSLRN